MTEINSGIKDPNWIMPSDPKYRLPSTDVREPIPELEEDEIDLRDLIDIILRRKWTIIIIMLLVFFTAAVYAFTSVPLYTAKGTIRATARGYKVTKFDDSSEVPYTLQKEFIQTQVELLRSNVMCLRVISHMDLVKNPYFNSRAKKAQDSNTTSSPNSDSNSDSILSGIKSFFSSINGFIKEFIRPSSREHVVISEELRDQILYNNIISKLRGPLSVYPVKNTELINLVYESPDPNLSVEVINAFMKEFLEFQMDSKLEVSKNANKFLEKQVDLSRIKLEKSEKQLNDFAKLAGIVSLDTNLNNVLRELEEINSSLAKARADRLAKEAANQQAMVDGKNLPKILSDGLIQNLKNQHSTLEAQYRDMATVFKDDYPEMRQIKAKLNNIRTSIGREEKVIIDSIRNEYIIALNTEKNLEKRAETLKEMAMQLNDKATQYKILQREVESNKNIYNSLLERSKEIESAIGSDVTNIQIADLPRTPMSPSKPKVGLILIVGIVSGAVFGILIAFFQEFMDNTIKSPDEMSERYKIPVLGLIPYNKVKEENKKQIATKFWSNPRDPISESIGTTMVSIQLSAPDHPPKTILVTSVLPGEGKTTNSCNMALAYRAHGNRVLIVDVDLRKPSLHHVLSDGENKIGLSNYLTGGIKLEEAIRKTEFERLDFISSGPIPPNPAELLASKKMRDLLQIMGEKYDTIFLDSSPFQGFAEILVLSHLVDGVILVSVLGGTPREGIKQFRKALLNVNAHLLGTIINKISVSKSSGYYKGYYQYGKYYYYSYEYGEKKDNKKLISSKS